MRFLPVCYLIALTGCATITADADQKIALSTTPEGAVCTVANSESSQTSEPTPSFVTVTRAFSPLQIHCELAGAGSGDVTANAGTRGRAFGNILLAGVPALVDAATGKGYEYADKITVVLSPEGSHTTIDSNGAP